MKTEIKTHKNWLIKYMDNFFGKDAFEEYEEARVFIAFGFCLIGIIALTTFFMIIPITVWQHIILWTVFLIFSEYVYYSLIRGDEDELTGGWLIVYKFWALLLSTWLLAHLVSLYWFIRFIILLIQKLMIYNQWTLVFQILGIIVAISVIVILYFVGNIAFGINIQKKWTEEIKPIKKKKK